MPILAILFLKKIYYAFNSLYYHYILINLEYLTPLKRDKTKVVNCPMVTFHDKRQEQPKSDNMFKINFTCSIANKTLCDQVNEVFVSAGKFISATLNLKSVINVNAQFSDL